MLMHINACIHRNLVSWPMPKIRRNSKQMESLVVAIRGWYMISKSKLIYFFFLVDYAAMSAIIYEVQFFFLLFLPAYGLH